MYTEVKHPDNIRRYIDTHMDTLIKAQGHFRLYGSVLAIAALAIALAWVAMTAGPTHAQMPDDLEPDLGVKPCGYNDTPHNPDEVVDSGRLLLFDAFWDEGNKVLHNNLCPPELTRTETFDPNTGTTTVSYVPAETNIDVTRTIIQIDDSFKHTLMQGDIDKYRFLDDVDETGVTVGDDVWWLRLHDDPDTMHVNEASALQLGFSTGRFNSDDWYFIEGGVSVKPMQYEFEAVRENDSPEHEHGHFYAFDPLQTGQRAHAIWDSTNADINEIPMWPSGVAKSDGSGDEPTEMFTEWVFTKPGVYLLEIHLKGHVHEGSGLSEHEVETSEVVTYTFHVGPLIDAGVELGAILTEPAAGDTGHGSVSYTVTASNSGLDPVTEPVVQVNLPEGLEFVHDDTPNTEVFHNNGTVTWNVGELAAPAQDASPVTRTLTFTAAVTADGAGQKLTASAEIRDLEYNELDRDHSDNTAGATVSPTAITKNRSPLWSLERSVPENSPQGAAVGAPVAARDADMDTLAYTLSGRGADKFAVDANGQITVAADARLDHETKWSYQLTLHVSDGKAADGMDENPAAIDRSMAVNISVEDVDENAIVTLAGSVHRTTGNEPMTMVTITATATNLPEGYTNLRFHFSERAPDGYWTSTGGGSNIWEKSPGGEGIYHYVAWANFDTAGGHNVTVYAHPINVEVTLPH